jgi:hypothetical protein
MSMKAFSIFHIPPNGVEVTDAEVISVRNSAGGNPHPGHAVVVASVLEGVNITAATTSFVDNANAVTVTGPDGTANLASTTAVVTAGLLARVTLPSGSTVITDQTGAIAVQDAATTRVNASAVIIAQTGVLSYVGLPGTAALATDTGATKIANSNGGGPVDAVFSITGGFLTSVNLAVATQTIVANGFTTGIDGYPAQSFATMNVSASGLQSVAVTVPSTALLVQTNDSIEVENIAENQAVNGTALVNANNTLSVHLPANTALVANNSAIVVPVTGTYVTTITPTVNASGEITAFVLS